MGTWLSDKYAEGTIGHRFYAGCQNIDTIEQAAVDHAKALFGASHESVQPHSGSTAHEEGKPRPRQLEQVTPDGCRMRIVPAAP